MSLEFSDSDTLLNYTGIVKTWSTCGQECVSVGVEGGSGCQRFDASRGNMCFSLRVRSSGGWEMLQVPCPEAACPRFTPQPPGTSHSISAASLGRGPYSDSSRWIVAAGSHPALFTFPRVRLYFSADGDGPALTGQISGTQSLTVYLLLSMA